ncbi:MAG: hypothetical protein AB1560_02055 [Pseudomonadota bacterium]
MESTNPDWIRTVNTFMPLVVLILSTLLGLIAWFGRTMVKNVLDKLSELSTTVTKQFTDTRDRIDQVEKDFLKFQAAMPRIYTLKDDHIRHMTLIEKKIDDLERSTQNTLSEVAGDVKLLLREIPKRKNDG